MSAAPALDQPARDSAPACSEMTNELDALARKYGCVIVGGRIEPIDIMNELSALLHGGCVIVGGRIEPIDMTWDAPDAEQWAAQYGVTRDGWLVRGFWRP